MDFLFSLSLCITSGSLTDRLIRMEYSASGRFEDRATLAFLHRNLELPDFDSETTEDGILEIRTGPLTLSYRLGSEFSRDSLWIEIHGFQTWHHGDFDEGNLLGTIRTLDGVAVMTLDCRSNQGEEEEQHCEYGLVSRDGWHVVDDSRNYVLDPETQFWLGPNTVDEDLYMFGYGHAYKDAIRDYNRIGGRVALVPKYMSGTAYTRWYDFTAREVRKVVRDHEERRIPLSLMILDMNWHVKNAWGSYTWDRRLYPEPKELTDWLHWKGLATAVNIHDASGVWEYEEKHGDMARALGLDPDTAGILFYNLVNSSYVYALEDVVWKHVEDAGIDFCWIDWQQGEDGAGTDGRKQNPTIWSNKIRGTNHIRRGDPRRGAILGRWGGLGNHR